MKYILLFLLLYFSPLYSFIIQEAPICIIYTPDSILEHKEDFHPLFVKNRERYSTCTGATWFHQTYLAVLNLFGQKIITYRYNPESTTFTPLQEINNEQGAELYNPENITISPDGSLLVVCADYPCPGVKMYAIDPNTHLVNPHPVFSLKAKKLIHNARFDVDGTYLATVGWDEGTAICIYKVIQENGMVRLQLVHQQRNRSLIIKPKAIHFTKNNRFVIIAYSSQLSFQPTAKIHPYSLQVHTFDPSTGSLGACVCTVNDTSFEKGCIEDIALAHNDTCILASDQAHDMIKIFPFDPHTGQIDTPYIALKNPEAQISFSHGICISPDEKYLAVTNYGDDKCTIYQIN